MLNHSERRQRNQNIFDSKAWNDRKARREDKEAGKVVSVAVKK